MTVSISNLLKYTAAAGLAFTLSGCNSAESDVQKVVIENLLVKDVYKFGEFTEVDGMGACQTVNTMGTNGRETGDLQAFVLKINDVWRFTMFQKVSHEECVTAVEELVKEAKAKKG